MRSLFQGRNLLLTVSIGNIMLWALFTFLIMGGSAFGQDPYRLGKLGPWSFPNLQADPILWWFNYVHTVTLIFSIPLAVIFVFRLSREDKTGLKDARSRIRMRNFFRKRPPKETDKVAPRKKKKVPPGAGQVAKDIKNGAPSTPGHRRLTGM